MTSESGPPTIVKWYFWSSGVEKALKMMSKFLSFPNLNKLPTNVILFSIFWASRLFRYRWECCLLKLTQKVLVGTRCTFFSVFFQKQFAKQHQCLRCVHGHESNFVVWHKNCSHWFVTWFWWFSFFLHVIPNLI